MPLDTSRPLGPAPSSSVAKGDTALADRLRRRIKGEVKFDAFSRGRYSTDASIYQIEPVGVVIPESAEDVAIAVETARESGVPILPRGGGTSQCGQTVGEALVLDCSKRLNRLVSLDVERRVAVVEPGIVLDELNAQLKKHGLFFPVDVSTSSQATIGGMTGNNSCGTRSLRYGNMVHNVRAIDAVLADGTQAAFGPVPGRLDGIGPDRYRTLVERLRALYFREQDEIRERFPGIQRRVGGYNLDRLAPEDAGGGHNMAKLLVGSEGTLAFFQRIEIDLQPIPKHKVLGICHFPTFRKAMEAAKPIVEQLRPAAVELVDRTMIELGREIKLFRPVMDRCIKGEPEALLFVEFSGPELDPELKHLATLHELMDDLGHGADSVVDVVPPAEQAAIWNVRKAGLNIMMSMKGDGKPVSFIEDCAVALEHLPDYTDRLTAIFHKYGTNGTWYAHASEGCLHVRPILNLKTEEGAKTMRAIAEEAFSLVREYKGSHSGEHGDGLVRSEWHEPMFGSRLVQAFGEVKAAFDPAGFMNPGKIVNPPRFDDRTLFRYKQGYAGEKIETELDWSDWGGFLGAVEMCNNNGTCRKSDLGVMCPSYRATKDEQHVTRGRANTLRLAITGQLGPDALVSEGTKETLALCVGCKGCQRECPTGVDMARMKVEVSAQRAKRHGITLRDRLIAYMPRYAPTARRVAPLLNLRDRIPGLAAFSQRVAGFAASRKLPEWSSHPFLETGVHGTGTAGDVVLFPDTFNRWFEPENLRAALKVLVAAGYRVHLPEMVEGRPLCCGRTFLASGLVDEARVEARRMLAALGPKVAAGMPVVGLEPSCLLTLRDEYKALRLDKAETMALAEKAMLFEEFLAAEAKEGRLKLPLAALPQSKALLHGHCHQKAANAVSSVESVLRLVPGLEVGTIQATCCGMAGSFGYQAETVDVSFAIGELDVLPAVRAASPDTLIVADGTSCRHQIRDGAGREAEHVAAVLARALAV